jgi:hypothetical protein
MAQTRGAYVAIDDARVDSESPITESLMFDLRDQWFSALCDSGASAAGVPDADRVSLPGRAKTDETDTEMVLQPDGAGGVEFRASASHIRYSRSGAVSMSDNTLLTWNSRVNSNDHADSSTTFTAPRAGWYSISGRARSSGSGVTLGLELNGSTWISTGMTSSTADNTETYYGVAGRPPIFGYLLQNISGDHDDHFVMGTAYLAEGETVQWRCIAESSDLHVDGFLHVARVA